MESRLREDAIGVALESGADRLDQLAIERRHDDAVVIRVRDEQAIRRGIRQDLAWIQQRPVRMTAAFEIVRQRRAIQFATLVEDASDGPDRVDEPFEVAL